MACLCIRIAPNDHPTDAALNTLRTQPGDVVELREDGHVWSRAERTCGQYAFLDVPGVPERDLTYLKDAVFDAAGEMLRRRKVMLDDKVLKGTWKDKKTVSLDEIVSMTQVRV